MAVRTNIEIDDELMKAAQSAAGTATKKDTVRLGLELLVRLDRQRALRGLRGSAPWDDDLERMRGTAS